MTADKNYVKLAQLHNIIKDYQHKANSSYKTQHEKQESIKSILRAGFNINYQVPVDSLYSKQKPEFTGYTFLHFVVKYKIDDILCLLFKNCALYHPFIIQITCKAFNGFTPLRLAFELMKDFKINKDLINNSLFMIVKRLLSAHIDLDIKTNPKCQNNISHFHIACLVDVKFANFFIDAGVDVNETVHMDSPLFPGFSPLHFAVQYGHPELVRKLLQCGAYAVQPDGNCRTPLRVLVDYNMQINDMLRNVGYSKDKSRLKEECLKKSDQMMEMLMAATNFDYTNSVDDIGFTSLHASCTRQDQDNVKKLLKLGVNINEAVKFDALLWPGYTPLHFAARCNLETVMVLLENGANLAAKDANGMTALDLCTERYEPTEISRILKMESLGYIRFGNNASLADIFGMINFYYDFKDIEFNAHVPFDSPIWPGYTILHLLVLTAQVKKKYTCKYFIIKNHSWNEYIFIHSSVYQICRLLREHSNFLFWDANGMTPLRLAFHLNKGYFFCKEMSSYAAKVFSTTGQENLVHVYEVFAADCPEMVEKLLKNGLDPNWTLQKDEIWYDNHHNSQKFITLKAGSTLLHIAALTQACNVIVECSKMDININATDADGLTAAQMGFLHSVSKYTLCKLMSIAKAQNYNCTTKNNLTHLHIACYSGNMEGTKKLLEVTSNINEQIVCDSSDPYAQVLMEYNGYTPLHFAVQFERVKIVPLLIRRGANVLKKNAKGLNSLHLALQKLKVNSIITRDIIKKVIKDDNYQDDFGITQVHLAYFINYRDISNLIEAGGNLNNQISFNSPIFPGDTPHHLFVKRNSRDCEYQWFLSRNDVDLTLKNADNLSSLLLLHCDETPFTKRYLNSILDSQDINKFCAINNTNNEGLSHLHIICHFNKQLFIEKFLENGADVNAAIDHFGNFWAGYTPLHIAARERNSQLIALLLQYGADVLVEDTNGFTPIHHIIKTYPLTLVQLQSIEDMLSRCPTKFNFYDTDVFYKSAFELLLKFGNDSIDNLRWILNKYEGCINVLKPPFDIFLKLLSQKSISDIVPLLVGKGADLSAQNDNGRNSLFIVISLFNNLRPTDPSTFDWYSNNVKAMIDAGCELDHRDVDGRTALHQAASLSSLMGVTVLLAMGADINIYDNQTLTPMQCIAIDSPIGNLFVQRAYKMFCLRLYLNPMNKKILMTFTQKDFLLSTAQIAATVSLMRNELAYEQLSVYDLLKEQLILDSPNFGELKRHTILAILGNDELGKRYPDWGGLFKLQRKRVLERVNLLKSAAVNFEAVIQLPLLCADIIVKHLSNEELKMLIEI